MIGPTTHVQYRPTHTAIDTGYIRPYLDILEHIHKKHYIVSENELATLNYIQLHRLREEFVKARVASSYIDIDHQLKMQIQTIDRLLEQKKGNLN